MQSLHILFAGAHASVIGNGIAAVYPHFPSFPVEPTLIAIAVRTPPSNPLPFAMAGTMVDIGGESLKFE